MTLFRLLLAKLRALVRHRQDDEALAEELAFHVDLLAEDLVRSGMTPQEARRQARLRLGGTIQVIEAAHEQRGIQWLETLARDLRLAFRSLRRSPLFAVTATLSLAIGVAANTVGFGFLYGYLIRPLPFTDGSRLVSVLAASPSRGSDRMGVTLQDLRAVQRQARSFDWVAASSHATVDLTGEGDPRRLEAGVVSTNLFQLLGIQPIVGRLFTADDERGASGNVMLLGERLWRSTFNGDRSVVGQAVTLDRETFTVVGVLPAASGLDPWAELFLPIGQDLLAQPRDRRYRFVAHLAPGTTIDQTNRDLVALSASLAETYPADNTGVRLFAEDLRTDLLDDNREPVLILYGVVSLLLLLACANVATLLIMRSESRSIEFAVRASLGAGRSQIGRQVLAEHGVVTIAGGTLGVLVGVWARNLLQATISPMPGPFRFDLDAPAAALLSLLVLSCAFLFGALSARFVARQAFTTPHATVRGSRASSRRARLRTGLAIFEVSVAALVLVGTGLMLKGSLRVASQPSGFDSRNVLTIEINLPDWGSPDPARAVQFFRSLTERIESLPQVENVSAGNPPPYLGWEIAYEAEGSPPQSDEQRPRTIPAVVMPGYFGTLRIPLIDGRDFTGDDGSSGGAPVIIVSQAFARITWPGERAIGQRVRLMRRAGGDGPWREVIGVVGDTRASTFAPPRGWVYLPHGQPAFSELVLMIRFKGDQAAVVRDVQQLVWKEEPGLPLHWNHLLDDLITERYWQPRVYPRLFLVFSAMAFAVALVGVYGVVAYASDRRKHEFGIRLAIGSPPSRVWRLVVRQGLHLAVTGTAIGILAAFVLMRLASTLFFGVSPTDGGVYVACGTLAVLAVLAASVGPAFHASRIDPAVVLRGDG
jgi:putative ABC transport system permease protein